jgi:hypothetical protein
MSSGEGARSVVFGGGGNRLVLGAGVGAAGPGVAGAMLGAAVVPQAPQLLQFGQTHCTVHSRTGVSLVTGKTVSLWISRTRQRQSLQSWQPGSQAPHPLADPLQFSQPWPRSQRRVTPGMQMSLHLQQYLCSEVFFVAQVIWQTGTSLQPQRGQHSQPWQPEFSHVAHWAAAQPISQPAGPRPASGYPAASPAPAAVGASPSKAMPPSKASPMVGNKYFVMIIVSLFKALEVKPSG